MSNLSKSKTSNLIGQLYVACKQGDVEFIRSAEENELFSDTIMDEHALHMMELATIHNQVEVIKYLFQSKVIFSLVFAEDNNVYKNGAFLVREACQHGNIEILDYLLNESFLAKNNFDERYIENGIGLKSAILNGNLHIFQYFLENYGDNEGVTELMNNGSFLDDAISYGRKDIVEYILKSPEMKRYNIALSDSEMFKSILFIEEDSLKLEMLKFFIFDLNIEKNADIEELLDFFPTPEAESLFAKREFTSKLEQELESVNTIKQKISKPKI